MRATVVVVFEVEAEDAEVAEVIVDDRLRNVNLRWAHGDGQSADPIKKCAVLPIAKTLAES